MAIRSRMGYRPAAQGSGPLTARWAKQGACPEQVRVVKCKRAGTAGSTRLWQHRHISAQGQLAVRGGDEGLVVLLKQACSRRGWQCPCLAVV